MVPLPPPLTEVSVPDCFSPSALGTTVGCRLKLVIASLRRNRPDDRLATGPEAAIGTLLHHVIERVGRSNDVSPEEIFQQEYERAVHALRQDPRRAHFAELASTKVVAEWARVKHRVLRKPAAELQGVHPYIWKALG
jgi:RecB family exonuclease